MAIRQVNGRWQSYRTDAETEDAIAKLYKELKPEEREAVDALVKDYGIQGAGPLISTAYEVEWDPQTGPPVPVRQWIDEDDLIGETGKTLYPILKNDLCELFEGGYSECILTGAIGWGKDYFATTCVMRVLYELLCLKNPQRSLGLGAGEPIHIVPISHRKEAARRVVFGGVAKKLNLSKFFRGRFEETMDEIRFKDKNIFIIGGSSQDAGALGLNVFCSVMDELNFMGRGKVTTGSASGEQYDKAQMIYNALARRVKSRYQHAGVKGLVFLVSSKRATDDFTERKIREAMVEGDPSVFVRDYATWDVKPNYYGDKKWHRVAVSPKEGRSRILDENEPDPQGCRVFKFPDEYLIDFQRDPDGCITGDTKIALLDGRDVPVKDLVGVPEFWTYSYGADGRLYPGRGYDARLTHINAPIVEVELDNGEKIRCTPDHKFMLRDGTYREAGLLTPGTSLMPIYRKLDKWGYEMAQSNVGGKWIHTHRVVASESSLGGAHIPISSVVHHKDFNKRNNSPLNLEIMLKEDHDTLHHQFLEYSIHSPKARIKSAEVRKLKAETDPVFRGKLLKQLEDWHKTYDGSPKHLETASRIGKEFGWGSKTPSELMQKARSEWGTTNITKLNNSENNPCYKEKNRKAASERGKKRFSSSDNPMFKQENKEKAATVAKETFTRTRNWGNHKRWHTGAFESCEKCNKSPVNHKVVAVRDAGFEDVYDLSVEKYHNFASACGIVVSNSTRDIAGIATDAVNPFIPDRNSIDDMMKRTRPTMFKGKDWDTSKELVIEWDTFMTRNARNEPVTICCPGSPRHAHLDMSKNQCATGFCIGHMAGHTEVMRRDDLGNKVIEEAPIIHIDCCLRIVAPTGGEIDHQEVRELIYRLTEGGLPIRSVNMDQWMAVPNLQLLKKKGFKTEELSVVRTLNPYLSARNAMYERRVESPILPFLTKELSELEMNKEGTKVDHPRHGCFIGSTRIPLLNGSMPTLESLVDKGDVWVYSAKSDGLIVPGKGRARKTKEVTSLVDVVLDSGAIERCTPEHLWMLRDGSYKPARDLVPRADSLMSASLYHEGKHADIYHEVIAVLPIITKPVPVYDLEVDLWSNFALCSGIFVHNSKDLADSWAGVVYWLTEFGKVGKSALPSKGFQDSGLASRNSQSGGPVYLGNGDFRWPDEEKEALERYPDDTEFGGMPGFIVM